MRSEAGPLSYNPFLPELRNDPYPVYRRLREQDPVHYSEAIRSWVLTRHADVLTFFSDSRLSSDRTKARKYRGGPRQSAGTFQTDPPQHTRIRSLVTKAFTPRVIDRMKDRVEAVVDQLLNAMSGGAELMSELAYPLPMTVISEILGVPAADHERFHRWGRGFAQATDHLYSGRAESNVAGEMTGYFTAVVARRRDQPADDLVGSLVAVTDGEDSLTQAEVIEVLVALLFAGHETTVNLIGNGLLALLRHPAQLERVRQGEVTPRMCVEELLRYDSPAQIISRTAVAEIGLGDRSVHPGDTVVALLGAANRDPEVFDHPDTLDVGRDPNPHLAFGHGAHFCLGAQLSRLEGRIAIPAVLGRFPRMELAARPVWRATAVLRGLEALPVRV